MTMKVASILLLIGAIGAGYQRWQASGRAIAPDDGVAYHPHGARSVPVAVEPIGTRAAVVPRHKLRAAANALVPRWRIHKMHAILHALRLWGPMADFRGQLLTATSQSDVPSSRWMLDIATNDGSLTDANLGITPMLYRTPAGIGVRYGLSDTAAHCDQLLKVLGEIGIPSSHPVVPSDGPPGTVADLVDESVASFIPDQELEFTTIAYCRYLPPAKLWRNRHGETFSFDDLAEMLVSKPIGQGACGGGHVLYALTILLRVDEGQGLIRPETRIRVRDRLRSAASVLARSQRDDGLWDDRWHDPRTRSSDEVYNLLTHTGHHLEWLALAPEGCGLDDRSLDRAANKLTDLILSQDFALVSNPKNYGPFSHAMRALLLLNRTDAVRALGETLP